MATIKSGGQEVLGVVIQIIVALIAVIAIGVLVNDEYRLRQDPSEFAR